MVSFYMLLVSVMIRIGSVARPSLLGRATHYRESGY